VCQLAEKYGFEFALSMIKFRGFGGDSEFWDYNLESFTLMSAIAARTEKIKLFASTAVLTLPPAVVARMAVTIDSVAPGRFGVNIVSGWAPGEYQQMGLWPGDEYFGYRYDYSTEYVQVMQDLWANGTCTMDGKFFHMDDCMCKPTPSHKIELVCAGQSERGMQFCAEYGDYQFILGTGVNTPTAYAPANEQLLEASKKSGRDIGSYVLFMVITGETDEEAMAKWKKYNDGADAKHCRGWPIRLTLMRALARVAPQRPSHCPKAPSTSTWAPWWVPMSLLPACSMRPALVPGTKGIMLTFDDFIDGLKDLRREGSAAHEEPLSHGCLTRQTTKKEWFRGNPGPLLFYLLSPAVICDESQVLHRERREYALA
jgi:pyrimidine oxygenase